MTAALLLALAVCAQAQPVQPHAQGQPPSADPRDIEAMIATLEDPEARSELIRKLQVLLDAERNAADAGTPLAPGDLATQIGNVAEDPGPPRGGQ